MASGRLGLRETWPGVPTCIHANLSSSQGRHAVCTPMPALFQVPIWLLCMGRWHSTGTLCQQ